MVRRGTHARLGAAFALAAALAAAGTGAAFAQGLPTLTVTALSMTSARTAAPAGETFAVTIHVHVAQKLSDLPWLVLPSVDNLTILGDEKRSTPTKSGSDFIEILSVAGIKPGEATLSPAYVDARDPSRGNKPFRFSSNALHLTIRAEAAAAAPPFDWRKPAALLLRTLGAVVLAVGLIVAAFAAFALAAARRKPKAYVTLPTARPVQPQTAADPKAPVRAAAARLAGVRSRANAASLREALFALAGARGDETLSALLARVPAGDVALRTALRESERATFVDEANLQGAIGALLDAVKQMGLA